MTPSKQKGTAFETSLLPLLQAAYPGATRAPLAGKNDIGDFLLPGEHRFIVEAKNRTQLALPEWLGEADREAARLNVNAVGVVVHKRKGRTDPASQYATMTFGDFLCLMARPDLT